MKYEFETIGDFVNKCENSGVEEVCTRLLFHQDKLAEDKDTTIIRITSMLVLTAFDRGDNYTDHFNYAELIGHEDVKIGAKAEKLEKESEKRRQETIDKIKKQYGKVKIIYGRVMGDENAARN